jgi:hypothetical protein
MSERKNEKWLDDQLQQAVNGPTPVFDAQAWKRKYAAEYEALGARGSEETRRGKPHPTLRIIRGSFGKLAVAAAVLIAAGVFLAGRFGSTPPAPGPQPVAQRSPAQMVSMISLATAFQQGGMEGLDKQCDRALEKLGPRPSSVSMQQLLQDINGKG